MTRRLNAIAPFYWMTIAPQQGCSGAMPYTTKLTEDCLGIVHVGRGVVTGDELVAASTAGRQLVQNTENFNYELVDLSGVTEVEIKPEHIEQIVEQDRLAAKERPRAMIVIIAPHEQPYQVAREWEKQVTDLGWKIRIFRDRAEGLAWLSQHLQEARADLEATRTTSTPDE